MTDKILLVEDNPQNMKVMVMALRPHGYTLTQAVDGEEGLNTAVKEKPDLIILDMRLPKMDGIEVTRRLRCMPEFNNVPIIAVTAYAMKGDREHFLEAGCDFYLPKPIDTRQLPRVVADILLNRKQAS
jgi:two-component system cell cycle response regulator DivK